MPELFPHGPAQTVLSLRTLGYPLYLMKITGFAKILGAMALLANRPARMVEWAYAGFSFLFIVATASHVLAGDPVHAPIPFSCFVLLLASYALLRPVRKPQTQRDLANIGRVPVSSAARTASGRSPSLN